MILENYCSEPKQPYEKKLNVLPGYLDLVKQTIPNLNMVNKRKWLHKLDDVVKILVEICVDLNQAMMGLSLVRTCLTFIQEHDKQFTFAHGHFSRLCYYASAYQYALPVIDKDFNDVLSLNTADVEEGPFAEPDDKKKEKIVDPKKKDKNKKKGKGQGGDDIKFEMM